MSGRVFLVAAEPSGDALAADLLRALRGKAGALTFAGVGGAELRAEGVQSPVDIADLSVLGLIDGLKAWRRVVSKAEATAAAALAFRPDVVVLVDSWGFTLRVAQRIRARDPTIPLVKYVGPQVWATRAGRAKTLAATVDHLICIHDFEPAYYAPHGLDCTVCGHPALGRHAPGDGVRLRATLGLSHEAPLLLVLPGSRRSEVRRVAPTLFAAAGLLARDRANLTVACVAAGSVASEVHAVAAAQSFPVHVLAEAEKRDAFAAATAALAASGTVTTEAALQGAPLVIGYKLGWVTWALARAFLFKARYMTLMNLAAGREVAPEFIQTRFTAKAVAAATGRLLDDPAARASQVAAQNAALDLMGRGAEPAANLAAQAVIAVMAQGPRRTPAPAAAQR